jgi:Fanconi anemia group M protein
MYIQHPLIRPDVIEEREYQVNIARTCIEQSNLVVLPTGMGKTICALVVIADRLQKFKDKILFLAPTKPLVEQHAAFLKEFLVVDPEQIIVFTGEVSPAKRNEMWNDGQIIVSTPQVIQNDLIAGRISLSEVSLVIFDEAHRAVGNYAYVYIGKIYPKQRDENNLVLGMTASPGNEAKKILKVCKNLNIEGVEIRSEYDPDVLPYVHEIDLKWVTVNVPERVKQVVKLLTRALNKHLKILYGFGLIRRPYMTSTKELLMAQKKIQGKMRSKGKKPPQSLYHAAVVQAAAIKLNHAIELAETQGITALINYFDRMKKEAESKGGSRTTKILVKNNNLQTAMKLAESIELEHPKIAKVTETVRKQLIAKPTSRIIVFTHYRDTSDMVETALNEYPGLRAVRFVGQASRGSDKGLRQKEQVELIKKFKEGEYNILVATSVAEEGLDIPATDLVVFYEPIPSEIRTIQRRGRTGRKRPGKVIVLITKQTRDEAYFWSSKGKEKRMKRELEFLRSELSGKLKVGIPKTSTDLIRPRGPIYSIPDTENEVKTNDILKDDLPPEVNDIELSSTTPEIEKVTEIEDIPERKKEGQLKLFDFGEDEQVKKKQDQKVKMIIDHREFNSNVVRRLSQLDVLIQPEQLDVGDFVLSDRVGVERKQTRDFLSSLIDGRLFQQLKRLRSAYIRPILIIEGDCLYTNRQISSNAVNGALASILADYNIPVITTNTEFETVELLISIAKREQNEGRAVGIRGEKGSMSEQERQQFIIEGLPNISATLAQRLLAHFGSVSAIMQADMDELAEVKGIGEKTAEEIKSIIDKGYYTKVK